MSSRLRVFFLSWLPWYLDLAAIFAVSSSSRPEKVFHVAIKDFLMHPFEFAVLAFLTLRAFRLSQFDFLRTRLIPMSVLFCLFYAASDEFHQLFVPGRTADLFDWIYDSIGIAIGVFIYLKIHGQQTASLSA